MISPGPITAGQVSFFLGITPVFIAWIYSEILEHKKRHYPSKVRSEAIIGNLGDEATKEGERDVLLEGGLQPVASPKAMNFSVKSQLIRFFTMDEMFLIENQSTSRVMSESRVEHMGGDMFETVPSADAIFMKWIMHDWGDEDCINILKSCKKAIPKMGKLIIVDVVVLDSNHRGGDNNNGGQKKKPVLDLNLVQVFDLVMVAHCFGGRERIERMEEDFIRRWIRSL